MTFYERLKKHLTTKHYVLVTSGDGDYCVFSHITDYNGGYRYSGWHTTKERAMQYIGCLYGYTPEEANEKAEKEDWQIVEAFDIPQKQFNEGDIVVVAKNTKRLCLEACFDWHDKKEAMIGKECEIKDVYGSSYLVYTPDKLYYFAFPHSALSYPIDKEPTPKEKAEKEIEEFMEKTAKKYDVSIEFTKLISNN